MGSFEKARALGADGIEFDVHFSKDLVPVVHHDVSLQRIFGHPGVLESMTLKEIKAVTPGVPTLEEVLALKGLHFMIELKVPMTPAQVIAFTRALEGKTPREDYHLLAIRPELVREHSQTPGAAWMLVGELDLRSRIALSAERGYAGVAGHYLGMSRANVEKLHERGQQAGVGFVPGKNLYNREWSRGVDFVFTNLTSRLF
jgi:glycerophosphoryl diester phosphodiesterase